MLQIKALNDDSNKIIAKTTGKKRSIRLNIISAVCDKEDTTSAYSVLLSEKVTVVAILDVATVNSSAFISPKFKAHYQSLRIAVELF